LSTFARRASVGRAPGVEGGGATWDAAAEDDRLSVIDLGHLAPDVPVRCIIDKPDGRSVEFLATHTLSDEQIEWFTAGSAPNIIRRKHAGSSPS
jgi:hypothetical protein